MSSLGYKEFFLTDDIFTSDQKWAKKLTKLDKNINEIGFFINGDGESSVVFKDKKKNYLLNNSPFKHF